MLTSSIPDLIGILCMAQSVFSFSLHREAEGIFRVRTFAVWLYICVVSLCSVQKAIVRHKCRWNWRWRETSHLKSSLTFSQLPCGGECEKLGRFWPCVCKKCTASDVYDHSFVQKTATCDNMCSHPFFFSRTQNLSDLSWTASPSTIQTCWVSGAHSQSYAQLASIGRDSAGLINTVTLFVQFPTTVWWMK